MKKQLIIRLIFLSFGVVYLCGFSWPFSALFHRSNNEQFGSGAWIAKQTQLIHLQARDIDSHVLRLSLQAYINARKQGLDNKQLLTVIDYSKPSTEKRLWVFDMKNNHTLFNTWVSHGKNSGDVSAKSFSNSPGSLKSSIGVFV